MGEAPTSLKVVAILGIIWSALILLATPCSMFLMFHPLTPNPIMDQLRRDSTYMAFALGSSALNCCLGVLLLASSIGCLKVKPWARMGMNAYAVAYAVTGLLGTVFNLIYVMPKMREAIAAAAGGPGAMSPELFNMSQIIGAILGILFMAGIVLTILIIVNRKIAVDAFNGIFPADPTNFPVDFPPPPLPQ